MADFSVDIYEVTIEPHENADTLELACIADYRVIVKKGEFKNGDHVAYIPEGSIVPDSILEEMGLKGRLSGSQKNRVKAIRLRGVASQGLIYPMPGCPIGQDVAPLLGVTKYEPVIPAHLNGRQANAMGETLRFDIENIKKYPHMFVEGEPVVATEKLHGTWACLGFFEGSPVVTSKGLSKRGVKLDIEQEGNVYVRMFRRYEAKLEKMRVELGDTFYVLGEVVGSGIQDLTYGVPEPDFYVFDIYVGKPGHGHYINASDLPFQVPDGFKTVPVVYTLHNFNREAILEKTRGNSLMSHAKEQIREGIVIRPIHERVDPSLGRVILKSVSEDYLLREGGTELE